MRSMGVSQMKIVDKLPPLADTRPRELLRENVPLAEPYPQCWYGHQPSSSMHNTLGQSRVDFRIIALNQTVPLRQYCFI